MLPNLRLLLADTNLGLTLLNDSGENAAARAATLDRTVE